MAVNITEDALEIYKKLYPEQFVSDGRLVNPINAKVLSEVRMRPVNSEIMPFDVDTSIMIGPVKLNIPIIGAAMDSLSGRTMMKRVCEIGATTVRFRDRLAKDCYDVLEEAVNHKPCLVENPKCLNMGESFEEAVYIFRQFEFSTIPILDDNGVLMGMVFTDDIHFPGKYEDKVQNWMMPYEKLKVVTHPTEFSVVKDRLLNEQNCNVLPLVDKDRKLLGLYFMKDFFFTNPIWHRDKALASFAISIYEEDIERVNVGLEIGAGLICIDSSHGNQRQVLEQTAKVAEIVGDKAAVVVGNVADVDGFVRLAQAGAHAVKFGIGSGAICTTSGETGVGFPMWTLLREARVARKYLLDKYGYAPLIIADGSISGPGAAVVAIAAGAHTVMAGKWLVAAEESKSAIDDGVKEGGMLKYWGMASERAIKSRKSFRYGKQKTAAEGVEGEVLCRGQLKNWFAKDYELIQGGFSHSGAANIKELHEFGDEPYVWPQYGAIGVMNQLNPTVK